MADWSLKLMVQQPILPIPATLAEGLRYLVIKGKTQRNEETTAEFCQIAT